MTTLLYFSPVPWDSYFQRPHYFVRHFLGVPGRSAIWVDPYPTRLPTWRDFARGGTESLRATRPVNLRVIRFRALPIEPLPGGRWLNGHVLGSALADAVSSAILRGPLGIAIGRPSALALAALKQIPHQWSMYDAMDDFPEFYRGLSRRSARVLERSIAGAVGTILTASSGLWNKFELWGSSRIMVRNAFEMSALPNVACGTDARPTFGYIGCVADWFDWNAVLGLAAAVPNAAVEIIGPRVGKPSTLPDNIVLRPACSHEQTIRHLGRFSVGLIPFKRTRLTAAVDPIKYYAYRAMGLPVLSTSFGEMTERGSNSGIFFMDRGIDLAATAAAALKARPHHGDVLEFRAKHDWGRRFDEAGLFQGLEPA